MADLLAVLNPWQRWNVIQQYQNSHLFHPTVRLLQSAFRQLLANFDHQKITIPSYATLQDIFSRTYVDEEKRLNADIASVPTSIFTTVALEYYEENSYIAGLIDVLKPTTLHQWQNSVRSENLR